MSLVTERTLPEHFPHYEWSCFVLHDAYAVYPPSTPALAAKEHPHAESFLETVLSGLEDQLTAIVTSDPFVFIATWTSRVCRLISVLFALLTVGAVASICISLYPILAYIISPLMSLVIWATPCFLFPLSDFLTTYQLVIDLVNELTLDGVVYSIDAFKRHRRHECIRSA